MSEEIKVQKCGVRFNPPAVIVTYKVNKTGKVHRRTMPLRNFNKRSGIARVAEDLRNNARHKKYLEPVPLHQLEKLICVIRDTMNGMSLDASLVKNNELDTLDPNEDLNKVDEETLKRKKAIMDETFEKNRKKPGDPGFQYDIEKDFEGGAIESCDWDSDSNSDMGF